MLRTPHCSWYTPTKMNPMIKMLSILILPSFIKNCLKQNDTQTDIHTYKTLKNGVYCSALCTPSKFQQKKNECTDKTLHFDYIS